LNLRIFFVRFGYEDYPNALGNLVNHLLPIFSGTIFLTCIENDVNSPLDVPRLNISEDRIKVLRGCNDCGEFSAWDLAVSSLDTNVDDIILFVTSAYAKNYGNIDWNILKYINKNFFDIIISKNYLKNSLIGELSRGVDEFQNYEGNFSYWIRSHFFLMGISSLKKIYPFNKLHSNLKNVSEIFDSIQASQKYKNFIIDWLSNKDFKGVRWNKSNLDIVLDSHSLNRKVKSILLEHLMSQIAKNSGIRLVDAVALSCELFDSSEEEQFYFKMKFDPPSVPYPY
jgi:hypothetical protein